MKFQIQRPEGWEDFLKLGVASWLVISPFVLGFIGNTNATLSAMFAGCFLILFSLLGLAKQTPWEEWLSIVVCAIFVASPWFAGYETIQAAIYNAFVSSLILVVLAVVALLEEYREMREGGSKLHPHT